MSERRRRMKEGHFPRSTNKRIIAVDMGKFLMPLTREYLYAPRVLPLAETREDLSEAWNHDAGSADWSFEEREWCSLA